MAIVEKLFVFLSFDNLTNKDSDWLLV